MKHEQVKATYRGPANNEDEAWTLARQIAFGQTLGFRPDSDQKEYFDGFLADPLQVDLNDDGSYNMTVAFPSRLFGLDLSGLLTVIFGKISFVPNIQLVHLEADATWLASLPGPKLGWEGLTKQLNGGSSDSPLLMAILKPGIGPDPQRLADQFRELVSAGVQIVKDDEICIDPDLDSARKRLARVLEVQAQNGGIYVCHLTGPANEIFDRAKSLVRDGAQSFLFCPFTYGLSVLQALCCDPEIRVPIFVHPAWCGSCFSANNGTDPAVMLGTLSRWAGADAVLFPSPYGKIALSTQTAHRLHSELTRDMGTPNMQAVASIPSAGISAAHVPQLLEDFGPRVVVNAGTGLTQTDSGIAHATQSFLEALGR